MPALTKLANNLPLFVSHNTLCPHKNVSYTGNIMSYVPLNLSTTNENV